MFRDHDGFYSRISSDRARESVDAIQKTITNNV